MEYNIKNTIKGLRITGSNAEAIANKFIETSCKENFLSIIISNKEYVKLDYYTESTVLLPFNSDTDKNDANVFLKIMLSELNLNAIGKELFIYIDNLDSIKEIVNVLSDLKETRKVSFVSTFSKLNKDLTFDEKIFINSFKLRIIANSSDAEIIDFSEKKFNSLTESINSFILKQEIED